MYGIILRTSSFFDDIRIAIVIILFISTWQWFKAWTGSSNVGFVIAILFTYLLWLKYYLFAVIAFLVSYGMGATTEIAKAIFGD